MTKEQIDILKNQICKGASDDELKLFIQVCSRTKLDPFSRQIYGIKTGGRLQIQVSIDGLRLIAERSGKYRGQVGPLFCGDDGDWKDVWLKQDPPAACKIGVLHEDFKEPLYAICRFQAYAQDNHMWKKMPDQMIAKVAESLALRKAFPQDLSGIYSQEEMGQVHIAAPSPPPMITQFKDFSATQATVTIQEPEDLEASQIEMIPAVESWETYKVTFGKDQGKTIQEIGISACLDRIKWFEDRAKNGAPLSESIVKFKEMVGLAVQQGKT